MKIHIDLDCFFVSAERIADPSLIGKPVGVGGRSDQHIFSKQKTHQKMSLENQGAFVMSFFQDIPAHQENDLNRFIDPDGRVRGILTTASYEARKYGINTGTTISEALRKCPGIIIKKPNMGLYQSLSHTLHTFLSQRIPLIEQGSIDEFYGDLSGWVEDAEVPRFIETLKDEVKEKLNLPISIGAAPSRYTAKLATNHAKPFGTKTVFLEEVDAFIRPLKIEAFPGIGRKTAKKLHQMGLNTLGEIKDAKGFFMQRTRSSRDLYWRVCGLDDTPIQSHHERKSIGVSRTFDPIRDRDELKRRLSILSRHLSFAIMRLEVIPTTFHLSISYELSQKGKANLSENRLFSEQRFKTVIMELFAQADKTPALKVIRLSISASNFTKHSHRALSLLSYEEDKKAHKLTLQSKILRQKYGLDTLRWGNEI